MTNPSRQLTSDNHYVPCLYLRRFADAGEKLSVYRTLVSHPRVPLWKSSSLRGAGYLRHLYTRIVADQETDEIERWLEHDFETPAADAIARATSGAQMKAKDWKLLARFVAAQIVRTPAHFVKLMPRWRRDVPSLLNSVLVDVKEQITSGAALNSSTREANFSEYIPVRVSTSPAPDGEHAQIAATVGVGRSLWHFEMRRLLCGPTIRHLENHRWSILQPSEGLSWFTSDDPVILLNYYPDTSYDFNGGWGNPGTEILCPLSPRHLLYAQVGSNPPGRGEILSVDLTRSFRQLFAEHAFRTIFASHPDPDVPQMRPRIADAAACKQESEAWGAFHADQSASERRLRH